MTTATLSEMTIQELAVRRDELGRDLSATNPGSEEERAMLVGLAEVRDEMDRKGCPRFVSSPKFAAELTEPELLKLGAQLAILSPADDFDPTPEECVAHSTDKNDHGHLTSRQVNAELKRRGLKGRKVSPW